MPRPRVRCLVKDPQVMGLGAGVRFVIELLVDDVTKGVGGVSALLRLFDFVRVFLVSDLLEVLDQFLTLGIDEQVSVAVGVTHLAIDEANPE